MRAGRIPLPLSRPDRNAGRATVLLLSLFLPATVTAASETTDRLADAVITAKVKTAILLNRHLDSFRINVDTRNGTVTLRGIVAAVPQRDLAVEIAGSVDGVNEVVSRLRIDRAGEEPPAAADRTFTQKVRDATLTASVKSALLLRRGIRADRIQVGSEWGVVTLEGEVGSEAERDRVLEVVGDLWEVRGIRDHLDRISDTAAVTPSESPGSTLPDFLIASQVQQALALSRRVHGAAIRARAENGAVTLRGRVASAGERAEAVRIATGIWGVTRVIDRLEIDTAPDTR